MTTITSLDAKDLELLVKMAEARYPRQRAYTDRHLNKYKNRQEVKHNSEKLVNQFDMMTFVIWQYIISLLTNIKEDEQDQVLTGSIYEIADAETKMISKERNLLMEMLKSDSENEINSGMLQTMSCTNETDQVKDEYEIESECNDGESKGMIKTITKKQDIQTKRRDWQQQRFNSILGSQDLDGKTVFYHIHID